MRRAEAMKRMSDDYPIDVVIAWVDGSDKEWQRTKAAYSSKDAEDGGRKSCADIAEKPSDCCAKNSDFKCSDSGTVATMRRSSDDTDERYRDWGTLKYLFRGIEKYMPWVRTVHFVTCGQTPDWLNTSAPKLHMVNHTDYIPKEYLPTFNSHTIELNFHRIDGLAPHFIYFNDDMFVTAPVKRQDFFVGGLPVDMLALQPVVANPSNEVMSHIYLNNTLAIARHFNKFDTMRSLRMDYFNIHYPLKNYVYNHLEKAFPLYSGFYTPHGPSPLLTSTYAETWEQEGALLDATCSHRFRDDGDVSQYLIREWQKQKGEFVSENVDKMLGYFNISNDLSPIVNAVKSGSKKLLCINDANSPINFKKLKADLISAFEVKFPEKSRFER